MAPRMTTMRLGDSEVPVGGVEGDAVDDGGDEARIGKIRFPFAERQIWPDGDGGLFLPFGDDLNQQFGAAELELDVTELVELCGCPRRSTKSASRRLTKPARSCCSVSPLPLTNGARSASDRIGRLNPGAGSCPSTPPPSACWIGSCTTPASWSPTATPTACAKPEPEEEAEQPNRDQTRGEATSTGHQRGRNLAVDRRRPAGRGKRSALMWPRSVRNGKAGWDG
jgi:hypothetical protein